MAIGEDVEADKIFEGLEEAQPRQKGVGEKMLVFPVEENRSLEAAVRNRGFLRSVATGMGDKT